MMTKLRCTSVDLTEEEETPWTESRRLRPNTPSRATATATQSSPNTPTVDLTEEEVLSKGLECIHFGNRQENDRKKPPRTERCRIRPNTPSRATATQSSPSTRTVDLTEEEALSKGLEYVHFGKKRQEKVRKEENIRRFQGNYGLSPIAVAKVVGDLQTLLDQEHRIKKFNILYFFLTLHWLRAYPTYVVLEGPWNLCREIIGRTIKLYTKAIQRLKEHKIKWFEDGEIDEKDVFLVSVDGIHCRTYEVRSDPGKKWYSHKSHGAGFAYELAIAIRSNRLVWMNGPFYASKSDITMFRYGDGDEEEPGRNLRDMIPNGKRAIADSGYSGEDGKTCSITRRSDSDEVKEFKARAKSRQEQFNAKVKAFTCTATEFRQGMEVHAAAFESVCVLLQYDMEYGHNLVFEV